MRHRSLPLFSVQYHPEASPGLMMHVTCSMTFIALMKDGAR